MNLPNLRIISRRSSQGASILLVVSLLLLNLAPFGAQADLRSTNTDQISSLSPSNRVNYRQEEGHTVVAQMDDLVYFTTQMKLDYESAEAKITFENPYPNQQISLGFKDSDSYHYRSQIMDSPMMNSLNWTQTGSGPYLYQRTKKYDSLDQFLNSPPDEPVGVFDFDSNFVDDKASLENYQPSNTNTVIDTPLRGSITIYAYLADEPFYMQLEKQDLNWYENEDVMDINIYKGSDLVYSQEVGDDGDSSASRKPGKIQTENLENPGSNFPEAGIYKIEIKANDDVVTRKISTNLHKLVFRGPLYLSSSAEVFPNLNSKTAANVLYTNSRILKAKTVHDASLQNISVDNDILPLTSVNRYAQINTAGNVQITVPKSDAVLDGSGYFVFSRDQFFFPSKINTVNIVGPTDLFNVDYIISNYRPVSIDSSGARIATVDFDLSNAHVVDGDLSWLISAPGLKQENRSIVLKNIEISLNKKGWFD